LRTQYTRKVSYTLFLISLLAPFFLAVQVISEDDILYMIFIPLFVITWNDPTLIAIPLMGILYFPLWILGTYIAKIAYDSEKNDNITRYEYAKKVVIILIIQTCLLVFLSSFIFSAYPPPINIPLPITAIITLIFTKITVKDPMSPFKDEEDRS
jgi:hypothetical protein